jgi:hypothetical protein
MGSSAPLRVPDSIDLVSDLRSIRAGLLPGIGGSRVSCAVTCILTCAPLGRRLDNVEHTKAYLLPALDFFVAGQDTHTVFEHRRTQLRRDKTTQRLFLSPRPSYELQPGSSRH